MFPIDQLTEDHLSELCSAPIFNSRMYIEPLKAGMKRFEITSVLSICAFTATLAIESDHLTAVEESLYYKDPVRLASLFKRVFDTNKDKVISPEEIENARKYVRMPSLLSQALYDGYHGRGLIQLTWKKNYQRQQDKLGFPYVAEPGLLKLPQHAALTACSFWDDAKCNDVSSNMREVTLRVNGPALLKLDERQAQFAKNIKFMASL